ncbi:ABC transporter ATP-binding protein [Alicyclobacillus shizuokensis]|uniref:ABC transporter ATP-binding protein n=1 Tax=Alicyclobacillus shizuokensis TaxID=392014 RepID=UPI0008337185|nr:ABC transporter ATP-binding protein [Alicyclobacillus shizuokensis]
MNILEMRGVSWRRQGHTIIQDVDWNIRAGEHWAVVGRNGSGKTSLLSMINGYIWPSRGEVEVLGQRLGRVPVQELRRQIGWVSQSMAEQIAQSASAGDAAVQIVISGKYASVGLWQGFDAADAETAMGLLRQFRCESLADKPFQVLSQGEKQRVLLARAWMAKPRLLILDEPCTGLDLPTREELLAAIAWLGEQPDGPTLVYVTHHTEEILPCFSHTLLLQQGRVLAQGPSRDVLSADLLSDAFGLPVAVTWENDRPWVRVVARPSTGLTGKPAGASAPGHAQP